MFLTPYFAPVYFAPTYFPKLGGIITSVTPGRAKVTITGTNRGAKAEVTQ